MSLLVSVDRDFDVVKTFIRDLFPSGSIYATLLSPDAQAVIGKVGTQTRGVEHMLRRIGFRYAERIDPFDGGPHFMANVDEVSLISRTRQSEISRLEPSLSAKRRALVAQDLSAAPYFRAVAAAVVIEGEALVLAQDAATAMGVNPGDKVFVLPLD